jgi:hypothetical protein
MTKERSITKLELLPTSSGSRGGWVTARWERADGSRGSVAAWFRLKTAERWYIARLLVDVPTIALLRDVPLARIEQAVNADPEIREWIEAGTDEETLHAARRAASKRPRLVRPTGRLDDDFYRHVAAAYRGAVAHGLQPAKTLADESDSPQGSVNRWIGEARRRGYLPATSAGKARA